MTEGEKPSAADELNARIGKKIRERRKLLKITQKQLGAKLGVSYQQVQQYEAGRNRVSPDRLVKLAEILDIQTSDFFADLPHVPEERRKAKGKPGDRDVVIGEKLARLRKLRNLSRADLGSKIRLSHQQIEKYETGKNRVPSVHLYDLGKYLGVSIGYFFGDYTRPDIVKLTDRYIMALDEARAAAKAANDNLGEAVQTMTEVRAEILSARPRRRHWRDFLNKDPRTD